MDKRPQVSLREWALTKYIIGEMLTPWEVRQITQRSPRTIRFIKRSKNYQDYLRLVKEYNAKNHS